MSIDDRYPQVVRSILAGERLPELGPGSPNKSMLDVLARLTPAVLVGEAQVRNLDMANCCIAALWLHHDFLDESHTIVQDIETVEGSYWHGIMHRREPDAGNAKYWFRRVGPHEVIDSLKKTVGDQYRSPSSFIDFCERVRGAGSDDELTARRVQLLEWQLLFRYCWQRAV